MSDHFMHAFCTGELCPGRVSVKLLPYYTCTFLENILVKGKTRNYCPVNERKSSYISLKAISVFAHLYHDTQGSVNDYLFMSFNTF